MLFSPFRLLLDLVLAVAIGAGDEDRAQPDFHGLLVQLGAAVLALEYLGIHLAADRDLLLDDDRFLFPEGHEDQEQRHPDQQQADGPAAGDQERQPDEKNDERKDDGECFFHGQNIANPAIFCNPF